MKTESIDLSMYAAMQVGKPVKTYKKTILGQVYCTILDPFSNEPKGILLTGDPKRNEESTMIDVWNEIQDLFFRRTNKRSLETGMIIESARKEDSAILKPEPYATASDAELDEVLQQKYYTILSALNKCTNTTVLTRFLERARAIEKSEKIINTIISRISEIESGASEEEE
jgi:hypothetical protein